MRSIRAKDWRPQEITLIGPGFIINHESIFSFIFNFYGDILSVRAKDDSPYTTLMFYAGDLLTASHLPNMPSIDNTCRDRISPIRAEGGTFYETLVFHARDFPAITYLVHPGDLVNTSCDEVLPIRAERDDIYSRTGVDAG